MGPFQTRNEKILDGRRPISAAVKLTQFGTLTIRTAQDTNAYPGMPLYVTLNPGLANSFGYVDNKIGTPNNHIDAPSYYPNWMERGDGSLPANQGVHYTPHITDVKDARVVSVGLRFILINGN
jgi:hypothetical protein